MTIRLDGSTALDTRLTREGWEWMYAATQTPRFRQRESSADPFYVLIEKGDSAVVLLNGSEASVAALQ
jgi:hypothetical protein